MVALMTTSSMTSEILQKIISTVTYRDDRWIRLYVCKTVSTRLQPVRLDNTLVFIDCTTHKAEVGYIDFTGFSDVKEFHIDYFEVHELYRKQGYGREMFAWIEGYARRKGMQTIYITPYKSAIQFWTKMGFRPSTYECDEMIKRLPQYPLKT